jgi:hypothetical protein
MAIHIVMFFHYFCRLRLFSDNHFLSLLSGRGCILIVYFNNLLLVERFKGVSNRSLIYSQLLKHNPYRTVISNKYIYSILYHTIKKSIMNKLLNRTSISLLLRRIQNRCPISFIFIGIINYNAFLYAVVDSIFKIWMNKLFLLTEF